MSDISGLNLPLDVKAKLAELDLELSEGWLKIVHEDDNVTPEAAIVVCGMMKGGALTSWSCLMVWLIIVSDAPEALDPDNCISSIWTYYWIDVLVDDGNKICVIVEWLNFFPVVNVINDAMHTAGRVYS